jgi:carbon storage regulator
MAASQQQRAKQQQQQQQQQHQGGLNVLVLTRKKHERIVIGPNVVVTVVEVRGDKVQLGITAPKGVSVHRQEVADKITEELRKLAEKTSGNTK